MLLSLVGQAAITAHLGTSFTFSNASPPLPPAYYSNFVRQLVAGVKRQRERLFAFEAKEEVHKVGKVRGGSWRGAKRSVA